MVSTKSNPITYPGPIVQGPPRNSIARAPYLGQLSNNPIVTFIAVPTHLYYRYP